jgi:hypothetical protein
MTFPNIDDNKKVLRGVIMNTIIKMTAILRHIHTFLVDSANSTIINDDIKIYLYFIFYTYNING